jgi:hypothetical protein
MYLILHHNTEWCCLGGGEIWTRVVKKTNGGRGGSCQGGEGSRKRSETSRKRVKGGSKAGRKGGKIRETNIHSGCRYNLTRAFSVVLVLTCAALFVLRLYVNVLMSRLTCIKIVCLVVLHEHSQPKHTKPQ